MSETFPVKIIAHIHTDFPTKFGVPRQSGLIDSLESLIIFEPEYRDPLSLRGLEEFSHLWLIWQFSKAVRDTWSPTVRPPKLGGNRGWRLCHPLALPAKCHRAVLGAAFGN